MLFSSFEDLNAFQCLIELNITNDHYEGGITHENIPVDLIAKKMPLLKHFNGIDLSQYREAAEAPNAEQVLALDADPAIRIGSDSSGARG